MGVIDYRKLTEQCKWNKLTPSARILLEAVAKCTNIEGRGTPGWYRLKLFSGIRGNDTFINARKQLVALNLISMEKEWVKIKNGNRVQPRAVITYQITKTILWKRKPKYWDNPMIIGGYQSMDMGSMGTGKEGVYSLGVTTNIGVKEQPLAVVKESSNIRNREGVGGSNPTAVGETIGAKISALKGGVKANSKGYSVQYPWQVEAERIASYLHINNPSKSWYKLFREAFKDNKQILLQQTASFLLDYPRPGNKENLFFWKYQRILNGEE